jgi:type II secretory pathway pseudopilin PulG
MEGMTAIEVLVLAIIAVLLIAILLPATTCPPWRVSKLQMTDRLLSGLKVAIETYRQYQGAYPPDWIPASTRLHKSTIFDPETEKLANSFRPDPPVQCTAEALVYYLGHSSPSWLNETREWKMTDLNGNGLREVVDAWGRPFLYDRLPFGDELGYDCPDSSGPIHNVRTYDLFSIGPDPKTGGFEVVEPSCDTLRRFNAEAMKRYRPDTRRKVIGNW